MTKYGFIVCLLWRIDGKFYSLRSNKCALYQIESIIKFVIRFKSSRKKKYLYVEKLPENDLRRISSALFTRLFLSENGRVVCGEVWQYSPGNLHDYDSCDLRLP